MSPHLTDAEIEEITKPLTQGAARIKFFKRLGVKVAAKPNGQPIVGRLEWETVMCSPANRQIARPSATVITPDWQALRSMGGRKSAA